MNEGAPVRSMRDTVDHAASRRTQRDARRRGVWFALAAVVTFAVDQVTKLAVRSGIDPGERIDLVLGVGLVRARNEGIAFGLFPGRPGLVAVLTVIALVVIAGALIRLARHSLIVAFGGGLLIGGSMGNLIDRLVHGGVTDFIDPKAWPAFNVADIGIVIGAAIIALGLVRSGGRE